MYFEEHLWTNASVKCLASDWSSQRILFGIDVGNFSLLCSFSLSGSSFGCCQFWMAWCKAGSALKGLAARRPFSIKEVLIEFLLKLFEKGGGALYVGKRFNKERVKNTHQQSMKKKNLRQVRLCFITGCFIKPFKIKIIHFLFRKLIHSTIFALWWWHKKYQNAKLEKANCNRNRKLQYSFKRNENFYRLKW